MKNPLTMVVELDMPTPRAEKDIDAFLDRLVAKMEGRLHAKEDTFTLAYYITRKMKSKVRTLTEADLEEAGWVVHYELSYEAAASLAYELKTYPKRPAKGVLDQILVELDRGLREKKQHDRDKKRRAKQRNRPMVRDSRGI